MRPCADVLHEELTTEVAAESLANNSTNRECHRIRKVPITTNFGGIERLPDLRLDLRMEDAGLGL